MAKRILHAAAALDYVLAQRAKQARTARASKKRGGSAVAACVALGIPLPVGVRQKAAKPRIFAPDAQIRRWPGRPTPKTVQQAILFGYHAGEISELRRVGAIM